jgi:fucose permease
VFLAPCAIGGVLVLVFVAVLDDRRLPEADRAPSSLRQLGDAFYVSAWRNPDLGWAFTSRFLFVLAYAFLTTFQAYYLLERSGARSAPFRTESSSRPSPCRVR